MPRKQSTKRTTVHRSPIIPHTDPPPKSESPPPTDVDEDLKAREALNQLAMHVSYPGRVALEAQFAYLQQRLGLQVISYVIDRRHLRGVPNSFARLAFDEQIKRKRENLKNLRIAMGNVLVDTAPLYNIMEAAQLLKVSIATVRNYLARGHGRYIGYIGTERITIVRTTPEVTAQS